MDSDLKNLDTHGIIGIQQSATEEEIEDPDNSKAARSFVTYSKLLTILEDMGTRLDYLQSVNAKIAGKRRIKEYDSKTKKLDKETRDTKKELKVLRKEYLSLLATVETRMNKLFKRLETEKKKMGSFKLKVKWMENGVYNKDSLTSLFSEYGHVTNVVVLENKNVGLVDFKFKTSAINAKQLEVGYPNCPLTVSFLGDYGQDTKHNSNHTSAPNPSSSFSAYQNPNENQTENTSKTS